jgi:hypothetical protein
MFEASIWTKLLPQIGTGHSQLPSWTLTLAVRWWWKVTALAFWSVMIIGSCHQWFRHGSCGYAHGCCSLIMHLMAIAPKANESHDSMIEWRSVLLHMYLGDVCLLYRVMMHLSLSHPVGSITLYCLYSTVTVLDLGCLSLILSWYCLLPLLGVHPSILLYLLQYIYILQYYSTTVHTSFLCCTSTVQYTGRP